MSEQGITHMESARVAKDVTERMQDGASTLAGIAYAVDNANERRKRMTTRFAQDDYIHSLEDRVINQSIVWTPCQHEVSSNVSCPYCRIDLLEKVCELVAFYGRLFTGAR
jgi:hypothetical protein